MQSDDLTFRPWTNQDKPGILRLMRMEYGGRSLAHGDYFDWQYRQNPAGQATICCCEARDKTIAGIYVTIPVPMRLMGQRQMASLSLNTLTHPEYRKRGIFTASAEEVYFRLKKCNVAFTLGFPNENSHKGFVTKLGFTDVGEAAVMIRPHDLAGLMSTKLPFMHGRTMKRLSRSMLRAVQTIPPQVHRVQDIHSFDRVAVGKLREQVRLTIDADAGWLDWRYLKTPHRVHFATLVGSEENPLGLCVFSYDQRLGVKIGLIMELMLAQGADAGVVAALMARVFEQCAKAGCVATFALVAPASRKAAFLREAGFWKAPSFMQPHPYRVIYRQHVGTPVELTVNDIDISFGMNDT